MSAFKQWLAREYPNDPARMQAHMLRGLNAAVEAGVMWQRTEVLLMAGGMNADKLRALLAILTACRERIRALQANPPMDDGKSACDGSADGNPLRTTPAHGVPGDTAGVRGAPTVADASVASPAPSSIAPNPVLAQIDGLLLRHADKSDPALEMLHRVRALLVENDRLVQKMQDILPPSAGAAGTSQAAPSS